MDPITRSAPALPGRRILSQFWADLAFLHWRVDAASVAPLLPKGIEPDVIDGSSWVGLIPFRMQDTAFLGTPAVPYFGSFTEVNVRLYGTDARGRRGVVFASLEASRLAAVIGARVAFSIPYFWANASSTTRGDLLTYTSRRIGGGGPTTLVEVRRTADEVTDDPLADFLTARWLLFQRRGTRTIAMPNEHDPWPLYRAEVERLDDQLVTAAGLPGITSRAPDSVLYSPGVRTHFGGPSPV